MVDVGTQSETEDLSDIETRVQDRKPSLLQVVPEEEHEDDELVATFITVEWQNLLYTYKH